MIDLHRFSSAPALVVDDRVLTYADLDLLVAARADRLGERRVHALEARTDLDTVVTYLAALRARHPVLLTAPGRPADPRYLDPAIELHPDLAVLLGTSGSTGTPKLVRLSHTNLVANALAIAEYLHLDGGSRAATTLPLQYCYGLSVLNSHLIAGGSLWLTDRSVIDPGFFDAFTEAGATSFAGVPYTFQLLERAGHDWWATPGLRQVTQAGGRLDPAVVRDLAERAEERAVDFYVMYGQTEATARMAYLPPHLAASRPGTIGIPIPGGDLSIEDGELVYRGPNVMMGYAESPADLARGAELTELRTGDLAVQHDDGLYEIIGRRNRVAKLFGTRIDLDLVERRLGEHGVDARATARDDRLTVHVLRPADARRATALVTAEHCVPPHALDLDVLDEFPLTDSGKTDHAALAGRAPAEPDAPSTVRDAFTGIFGPGVRDDDSFATLAGDSLTYVELYVRLERVLHVVPQDWPQRTVAELGARRQAGRRRWGHLETPIVLRALAILLVVGSHVDLWDVKGGAHVLLAAFGFNLARFVLPQDTVRARLAALGRTSAEMMAPVVLWGLGVVLLTGDYAWSTPLALNGVLGPSTFSPDWWLWFIEAALWSSVGIAALLSVPWTHRTYARHPFAIAFTATVGALALRTTAAGASSVAEQYYSVAAALWCVTLGWAVAVARTRTERVLVSALATVAVLGWFDTGRRDLVVLGGVLALAWLPRVPVPRVLAPAAATVASASMFVYLTHWQVYPQIEDAGHRVWALVASFALGLAVHLLYTRARRAVRAVSWPALRARPPASTRPQPSAPRSTPPSSPASTRRQPAPTSR